MEELIKKAKEGDKEAFTQAILLVKISLYKIAKMRTSKEEDVQDIMQDTMIDAYKNIKRLKDASKFKTWIIKILINNCNKYYKKYSLEENYDIEYYRDEIKYNENQSLVESTLNFYEMIKSLRYEERMIIILYYLEKYTIKEISKILGINENTIKTRLSRAKEKIKNNYKGGQYNG